MWGRLPSPPLVGEALPQCGSILAFLSLCLTICPNICNSLDAGANSGIGLALTKQLVAERCHVYLGSRNAAVEEVKASAGDSVELLTIVSYCDV